MATFFPRAYMKSEDFHGHALSTCLHDVRGLPWPRSFLVSIGRQMTSLAVFLPRVYMTSDDFHGHVLATFLHDVR